MQVYDTMSRERRALVPVVAGAIGMYVCGATVQSAPHLGHGRQAVAFDVIRRYLEWSGYRVTYVMNVTDVEDKIIDQARQRGVTTEQIVAEVEGQFDDAFRRLRVREPDIKPRATEHIPEMVALVERLIATGHAYAAGGDVYFAVRSFPGYGRLSGRDPDDLLAGARVEPGEQKRDPLDFALWKAAKPGEPSWDSPWGPGRPGWHIECSAMAERYLGFGFDVHGGGADLIFPHHENEIAQSEAAAGDAPFARHWLHNGLLNLSGEKMAKSTGRVVDLGRAIDERGPLAVRLYYLRKRYREPMEFSPGALEDAAAQLDRLWSFRRRVAGPGSGEADAATLAAFRAAMDDDFNTAGAISALFEAVREGNRLLDAGEDAGPFVAAYDEIMGVLGLAEEVDDLAGLEEELASLAARFAISGATPLAITDALISRRELARRERDFGLADGIRDDLARIGVRLEDTSDGTRWHRG